MNAARADDLVWGLTATQLHDAYWASHGVACVELGSGTPPQPSADLYLLVERGQAVIFDLRRIAESLLWNKAHLTRVRVTEPVSAEYGEHLQLASDGTVAQIERRYRAQQRVSTQVFLATRADDAAHWSASNTQAEARASMRRHRRIRFDTAECAGHGFDVRADDDPASHSIARERSRSLLRCLVNQWPNPHQVLHGVEQLQPGVFGLSGTTLQQNDRCVAPLWIGRVESSRSALLIVGPEVIHDQSQGEAATIPLIEELFSPERAVAASSSTQRGGVYPPLKRLLDIVLSIFALVVMSPVLLMCAVAIVLHDGFPIFFGHRRQTTGGAIFRCWKFRTMRKDAESRVAELRKLNLCDGPQVNIKEDPRVTPIGKVLRKLQLDEFPQFFNVICGDMSIVGPRPSPDNENQYCPAWREIRLSVRPGITGLWQVKRTREAGKDFQEWIRYDMEYVERMGPLFDAWICILTVFNLLFRRT